MIRPITYTYKGRPLAPFGTQRSARSLRRRTALKSAVFTGVCVLLILAAAAALAWWMSSCFESEDVPADKKDVQPVVTTPETAPVVQPAPEPAPAEKRESASAVSPVEVKTEPSPPAPPARLSESTDRNAYQVYSAAATAFQKKDYENARRALRLFFENLQVPPGHPLYNRACAMLSDSSLAIYRAGTDSSVWKTHKVERGENLSRIAKKYGTDVQTITEVNQLKGTALKIGQELRIPQGSWRIRLERRNRRILLDNSGRLFKIYPVEIGPLGGSASAGLYRIQHTPARILFYGTSANAKPAAVIQPHGEDSGSDKVSFFMQPADLAELIRLIPDKSPAEILK